MEVTDIQIKELWEKERIDFDYEAKIYEWLGFAQKIDLRGLGRILLVNYSSNTDEKENRGNWIEKERGTPVQIELCIQQIQDGLSDDEKNDPEALGAHIAFELFRQVGRNSIQFKHGITKQKHEGYMHGYAKKIFTANFPGWKIEEGVPKKES
jgi:hypothetical protein